MSFFILFITALALAADAFAVSVSNGIFFAGQPHRKDIAASAVFGIFQGIMPIFGYWAGFAFVSYISQVDHWIAFILLSFIGIKMIADALKEQSDTHINKANVMTVKLVLTQGISTSIDAFAVGLSFAALNVDIYPAALTIALVTFFCCLVGHYLGKQIGKTWGNKAHILGGILLIATGVNILIEHLFF